MKFDARVLALSVSLLGAAACATPQLRTPDLPAEEIAREAELQRRFAFEHLRDERLRVLRIAYRLTTAAHDLCGDNVTGATGVFLWTARNFTGDEETLARSSYDIHDGYTILAVAEGSPAAQAGLRGGDRILSVDGVAVPEATRASLSTMRERAQDAFRNKRALPMEIARQGSRERETVSLALVPSCDYQAGLLRSDVVNAFADGNQIIVTTGMMNFIRSDRELAMIMGHELSHNFLGHIDAKRTNSIAGAGAGLLVDALVIVATGYNPRLAREGGLAGAGAYSVAFEQEADYAGLYVMARAGYDIDGVSDLWRRMALDNANQIGKETDHPTSAARFVAMEAALREIRAKEAGHEPLVPALKKPK